MVNYYWSSIVGADWAAAFATRMRDEGFSRFEEVIDEFRGRFGAVSNFSGLPKEIESARRAVDEEKEIGGELLKEAEKERDLAENERDHVKATNQFLRHRIELLEGQSASSSGTPLDPDIPTTLEGFGEWCARHLTGSVEMHPRAFQGIKRSEFQDVSLIYKALLVLRDHYVPMKRQGGLDRLRAFEQACAELGITEGTTFSGPGSGEQGDDYFIRVSGCLVELDRHIKKGVSYDPGFCLRIYFFWDEKSKQVVVGWLPSHLGTRDS